VERVFRPKAKRAGALSVDIFLLIDLICSYQRGVASQGKVNILADRLALPSRLDR